MIADVKPGREILNTYLDIKYTPKYEADTSNIESSRFSMICIFGSRNCVKISSNY